MIKGRFLFPDTGDITPSLEIRRRVFEDEIGVSREDNEDGLDELSVHGIVLDGETPIAAARMIFAGGKFVLSRVCVLKEYRGKYNGDFLVRMMCDRAFTSNAHSVTFEVREGCEPFAEKIGFVKDGEKYTACGSAVIPMRLDADKFVSKCCGHSCVERK